MVDKYALISVSDKTGVVEIAKKISETHKIIASSGTAEALRNANIVVIDVSEYTRQPELFDGRVKTLHPKIYAGILSRDDPQDIEALNLIEGGFIDFVICNLADFHDVSSRGRNTMDKVDIGGHTLIRAAAKNFDRVTVIVDPDDYSEIISNLPNIDMSDRIRFAAKAFNMMANYDIEISKYMNKIAEVSTSFFNDTFSKNYFLSATLVSKLRYGENPHQSASYYKFDEVPFFEKIAGPEVSYNNILDMNAGWDLISEFQDPACVIIKHRSPCGVAISKELSLSYKNALSSDKVSAYGGVYIFNKTVDKATASELAKMFVDVIFAPDYEEGVLEILKHKDKLTITRKTARPERRRDISLVAGGFVVQERDKYRLVADELEFVSNEHPSDDEFDEMKFAWSVVKHVRSNAIVISKGGKTIGIGTGQTNRVAAVRQAITMAGENAQGTVMASDAFFPFPDSIKLAGEAGIDLIISPKGSIRDEEVIEEANRQKIKLVFTNKRAFKH